jgi:hypothetical protein
MYGFAKVPAGLTYSLVAIKLKDGFPFLSIQNFTTLPSGSVIPEYKKVTVPELKEALAGL